MTTSGPKRTGGGTWGSITGDLSTQSDLISFLASNYLPIDEFTSNFDSEFSGKSTSDLSEGTNLYFTNERVDDRLNSLLQAGSNIGLAYNDILNTLTITSTPSGADTYTQYNDNGVLGGDANNTWNKTSKLATYKQSSLGATTADSIKLENTTAATVGTQVQISPSFKWTARGWKTNSVAASQPVEFRANVLPITGAVNPRGSWQLQYSINSGSYTNGLEFFTTELDGVTFPKFKASGAFESSINNSSTLDTLQSAVFSNPSGSRINIAYKFGSTIKGGKQIQSDGSTRFMSTSSAGFFFQIGSNISSVADILEIYSGGLYNYGGSFNQGRVTAGQADISPPAYLNTYGSFAGRGTLITTPTHTMDENQFVVLGDADSAFLCSGTPNVTACSTYTGAGQATCESHLPCQWNSTDCSGFGGVDQSTCETGHPGCSFASLSCSGASNTDQSTCESQDDSYGGNCSWDTSTCPSQTSTASCSAIPGCTPIVDGDCSVFTDFGSCSSQPECAVNNGGDCSTLSDGGGDGTACATQPQCSYDSGSGVCSGNYFTSCSGNYFTSCSGNLCAGNYFTGACSGTWTACVGTVSCASYLSSSACSAETGCTPSTGAIWTLPLMSLANEGNVSRFYKLLNVGATGVITLAAGVGNTLHAPVVINPGESAEMFSYEKTSQCTDFTSEGTCTPPGCSWVPAVVCADLADESSCNSQSGYGCSWNGSSCSGAGAAAYCSGNYISSKKWYDLMGF